MKGPDHILFGGTFDPPHQGHVEVVSAARQSFPESRISIMPSPFPAGADGQHKQPTSFQTRWEMCQQVFSELLSPQIQISDTESALPAPHYTINTLRFLKSVEPATTLGFLLGEDQLASFPKWREPEAVLKIADLIVVKREGAEFLDHQAWQDLGSQLGRDIKLEGGLAHVDGLPGRIIPLAVQVCGASSTALRNAYNRGKEIPAGWVPPAVDQWIREHKLYV